LVITIAFAVTKNRLVCRISDEWCIIKSTELLVLGSHIYW
jgi:hypothetical protein